MGKVEVKSDKCETPTGGGVRKMAADIISIKNTDLTKYDPEKGLKSVAVAEAAEKHWARAKDAAKLFEAVNAKILEQAKYVVWRDGVTRQGQRSDLFQNSNKLPGSDPGHVVAHRWRKSFCVKAEGKTVIDQTKLGNAQEEAGHRAKRICEQENDGTVRGTEGTGEVELYTPAKYIDAARLVLGEIDLDPASNDIAQKTVKAAKYFTVETNGLNRQWKGRVWLNPPYHRELLPAFVDKMVAEVEAKRVTAAVMLTNNCTDTEWFAKAHEACAAICFTKGRVKFMRPNGLEVAPTQGQAIFYFGDDIERFESVFFKIGFGMIPKWDFEEDAK